MQKLLLYALFVLSLIAPSYSQTLDDFSQGSNSQGTNSQGLSSQGTTVDCSDPMMAGSVQCSGEQGQRSAAASASSSPRTPVLSTPYGFSPDQYTPSRPPLNPSQVWHPARPTRPETEFEQMVADSLGRPLPLFGQSLFVQAPSTFAPVDWMQVPSDYIIGPGDELQIKIWGQVEASLRVMVDRSGQIYIPQVGEVTVAGVHYGDLEQHLKTEISKIFKNFTVTASIGRLRSIQVIVVGNARYPGTYTISSLSTLVNAVFASGGPSPAGVFARHSSQARWQNHYPFRLLRSAGQRRQVEGRAPPAWRCSLHSSRWSIGGDLRFREFTCHLRNQRQFHLERFN